MSTTRDENPQPKQGRSLVDRAMHIKRKAARKLSTVSGVDIIGGALDAVEKADQMIDKLPYYQAVEETMSENFVELSDEDLTDDMLKTAISVACLSVFALGRKRTDLFLKKHETSKASRIFAGTMALPMAATVVMMAVEKRRRGKLSRPNPYYVPIDEVAAQTAKMSDDELRAVIRQKINQAFGE